MIFHEYSLIFFTVLAQTAVGGYLLVSAHALVMKFDAQQLYRYRLPMFVLWAIMGLGFLFSTTHLGSPLRALNAFNKIGSAWLSNEVLFGAAFFAVGGLQWLLSALKKGGMVIQKLLMIVAMVLGILFMYSMIKVYMINTVPTWFNAYTPLSFVMTILLAGLLLGQWILVSAKDSRFSLDRNIVMLAIILVAASIIVTIGKAHLIGEIHNSVVQAATLVDRLATYLSVQIALLMSGLLIWVLPMINRSKLNPINLGVALGFIIASELVGRGLFYSLHMTSGL
ncbi:dimethyl sulfoxide reductase anchor subunit (plasmid) [Vibrio sp. HDW18]|uniref:DmsC/YnfH family molybdoenzyme membrane anchor subunit n=1 Tax=Vibrio sp. HDW18 TaxID=2714948 RepID=UPI00140B9D7A|nr:DmsC/YnfH family molybdoenzyme membrane anchor subunit [Vibrio sp. HDW18]QIL86893.1 dimethyl sulfoxide reductase anchor subunit [Vibrio sp. HDW18]